MILNICFYWMENAEHETISFSSWIEMKINFHKLHEYRKLLLKTIKVIIKFKTDFW